MPTEEELARCGMAIRHLTGVLDHCDSTDFRPLSSSYERWCYVVSSTSLHSGVVQGFVITGRQEFGRLSIY